LELSFSGGGEREVGDGVRALELHGGLVVHGGGFLRRVEGAEPDPFSLGRVANLGGPPSPWPLPDTSELVPAARCGGPFLGSG